MSSYSSLLRSFFFFFSQDAQTLLLYKWSYRWFSVGIPIGRIWRWNGDRHSDWGSHTKYSGCRIHWNRRAGQCPSLELSRWDLKKIKYHENVESSELKKGLIASARAKGRQFRFVIWFIHANTFIFFKPNDCVLWDGATFQIDQNAKSSLIAMVFGAVLFCKIWFFFQQRMSLWFKHKWCQLSWQLLQWFRHQLPQVKTCVRV